MKSPISFIDWLHIVGIVFILCVSFLLLMQIPFIDNFLDKIKDFIELQSEYIF